MAERVTVEQLGAVERKVDALATSVETRFDAVDAQFEGVAQAIAEQRAYTDAAFARLEARFDALEGRFDGPEGRFDTTDGRLARIERKLDQFIDMQSKTNELVERRLTRLESSG